MQKTIAIKLLEGKRIDHEVLIYPDEIKDAEKVAAALELSPDEVFKTLVVAPPGDRGRLAKPLLVMVPAPKQLDLKKLARELSVKKVKMASYGEAEEWTGLQVGGISAVALLNKGFAVYLDQSARNLEQIVISAGQRGIQIRLAVKDLVKVTRARFADVGS